MTPSIPAAPPSPKTLLILGGSHAEIPLIKAGKDLGFRVVTSGNRPSDLGHPYADEYRLADFSNREEVLALARELEVDAICSACNDFAAISAAYVAEKLGLPGHDSCEVTTLLHHKDRYRDFAIAHAIPTPRAWGFSSLDIALQAAADLPFPMIVKPVDLTGGKGVRRVDDAESCEVALREAFRRSRSKRVVIEEFVEGSNHGYSALLRGGKVAFHFADDEYYFTNRYMVSGASTPTTAPPSAVAELKSLTEKIARVLNLRDGIFHVQFILRDEKPVIIEVCRRSPGDLYIELVRLATGMDYPRAIVEAACGLPMTVEQDSNVRGFYLRHCVMTDSVGVVKDIERDPEIAGKVVQEQMWWKPGDRVEDFLHHKFGIVFLEFDSAEELRRRSNEMPALIRPVLVKGL